MGSQAYLLNVCSVVYATLAALIAIQARRKTNLVLACCCGITATWAGFEQPSSQPLFTGAAGFLDTARLLAWYIYLLYLYRRSGAGPTWQILGFAAVAAGVFCAASLFAILSPGNATYTLLSLPISIRLFLCITELLLIENLYLNLPENTRWHVALPCIVLGGLACFDIVVVANTYVFRKSSIPLANAQAVAMIIIAPLLVLTASRAQRWSKRVQLSRSAVFHSATLVLSGAVLLLLAATGEVFRQTNGAWGWVAELCLLFAGLVGVSLVLSSRTAKTAMERFVVDHFFADRYDYRVQWLGCIKTLSGKGLAERSSLQTRAIRVVADAVNSPSGALFLLENSNGSMFWAGSWNMPAAISVSQSHPLIQRLQKQQQVADLQHASYVTSESDPLLRLGPVWLAVPLLNSAGLMGLVIVGPPRIAFPTDQEVFDLLGIIGQEVGTYITEQRATATVLQNHHLREYGKRFAFVAHDIKNISSQLALLLSNAEHHIGNPEFQLDMLETVRSSAHKIDKLLKRLDEPSIEAAPASIAPVPRLDALLATYRRVRKASLILEHDGSTATIAMAPDPFDAAITHLLNNAVEAAPSETVVVRVEHGSEYVVIEVVDHGPGMSPEFIRDELFSPFKTSKRAGSGIGAFQARELISEFGGELIVASQLGLGTTIQVSFRRADKPNKVRPEHAIGELAGE